MREFNTAVKEKQDKAEGVDGIKFKVDGRVMLARQPLPSQVAYLMGITSRQRSEQDQMGGMMNFVDSILGDDDSQHLLNKLLDPEDDFDTDDMMAIVRFLLEEWSARPTQPVSGSTGSQPTTGPESTLRTQESTSSNSVPTAS